MNIKQYLDSTYLKTPSQAGLSEAENTIIVKGFIQEAIDENFKLIMIRPDMVSIGKPNDYRCKFNSSNRNCN